MKKIKKHLFLTLTLVILLSTFFINTVQGQGVTQALNQVDLNTDPNIGLETIAIPFFPQIIFPGGEYATLLSWVSFIGGLASLGIIAFWIALIVRAGFRAVQSQGEEEGLQDAFNKMKSLFIGAGLSILFPVVLSIFGYFLGVGNLWAWPAAFRDCPNSASYDYYFQAVLSAPSGTADPKQYGNNLCF